MIGVNLRSTLDIDATIKGVPVSKEKVLKVIEEIIKEDIDDNVSFSIENIRSIHSSGKYQDFRITLEAKFFNIKEFLKIDLTTGDLLVPREVSFEYKLMFEDRVIKITAYHLYTILAEKLETVLSRNVANTRARDFYDLYILGKMYGHDIDKEKLKLALTNKFEGRNTVRYLEESDKYLDLISDSPELKSIWINYKNKNNYAKNIEWLDIILFIKSLINV